MRTPLSPPHAHTARRSGSSSPPYLPGPALLLSMPVAPYSSLSHSTVDPTLLVLIVNSHLGLGPPHALPPSSSSTPWKRSRGRDPAVPPHSSTISLISTPHSSTIPLISTPPVLLRDYAAAPPPPMLCPLRWIRPTLAGFGGPRSQA
jgi:hypothetical protein